METNKATFIVTSVSFVLVESILMARHSLSVSFKILSAVFKQSGQYKQTRNRRQKGVKECIRDSHRIATLFPRDFQYRRCDARAEPSKQRCVGSTPLYFNSVDHESPSSSCSSRCGSICVWYVTLGLSRIEKNCTAPVGFVSGRWRLA
jgi:hypothetical protein